MRGNVKIRLDLTGDLEQVTLAWHESASQMDGIVSPVPSIAELRDRINVELSDGWKLLVPEVGDAVVGILAINPADAILDQIFVHPNEQGRGVGSILLIGAKQEMPNGFRLQMASDNSRAALSYESSGLERVGNGVHPRSGKPVRFYRWNGS